MNIFSNNQHSAVPVEPCEANTQAPTATLHAKGLLCVLLPASVSCCSDVTLWMYLDEATAALHFHIPFSEANAAAILFDGHAKAAVVFRTLANPHPEAKNNTHVQSGPFQAAKLHSNARAIEISRIS